MIKTKWIEQKWKLYIFPILLIGFIISIAHFFFAQDFGIFEDDVARVALPYDKPLLIQHIPRSFIAYFKNMKYFEGRPLGFFIPQLLVSIFRVFKSLPAIYYCGSLIIISNAALFYVLIMKITNNRYLSFLSAVIFTLYPADTTQNFLLHIYHIQFGLSFLLLAFLAYFNHQEWLGYVFAVCILLDYETPYWIFLIAPLMKSDLIVSKPLTKKLLKHTIIMVCLFIIYAILRILSGESRMVDLMSNAYREFSLIDIPFRTFFVMLVGPFYSVFSFLAGPYDALTHLTSTTLISIILSFLFFCLLFIQFFRLVPKPNRSSESTTLLHSKLSITSDQQVIDAFRLMVLGIIAFPLSYMMGFHLRYFPVIRGKVSSVHMASAFPGAMLIASLFYLGAYWLTKKRKRVWAILCISLILSSIVGYRFWIQQDMRLATLKFSRMVAQVLPQIQDVGPDTLVIVDASPLQDTRFLPAYDNRFVFYQMLETIYELPDQFYPDLAIINGVPRVDNQFFFDGENYFFDNYIFTHSDGAKKIKDKDIIMIVWDGQQFVRQYDGFLFDEIAFKPLGELSLPEFQKTSVFDWYYHPELSNLRGPLEHPTLFDVK